MDKASPLLCTLLILGWVQESSSLKSKKMGNKLQYMLAKLWLWHSTYKLKIYKYILSTLYYFSYTPHGHFRTNSSCNSFPKILQKFQSFNEHTPRVNKFTHKLFDDLFLWNYIFYLLQIFVYMNFHIAEWIFHLDQCFFSPFVSIERLYYRTSTENLTRNTRWERFTRFL